MISDQKISEAFVEVFKNTVDRPIAFHPIFAKLTGSVTAGVLLSQAVYWTKRATSGGWFYKTIKQWEEETSLSRHEQDTARKTLRRFSFWKEERRGVPAQMYYHVDMAVLYNELLSIAESRKSGKTPNNELKKSVRSSLPDSGKLDCGDTANKDAGKRQTGMSETGKHYSITETTAEITTETTTTVVVDEIKKLISNTPFQAVNEQSLRTFAKQYGVKHIFDSLDMLIETYKQSGKPIKNPGAILSIGLMRGVTAPSDYVPYHERIEKEKKAKETADQRRIAAETKRKDEDEAYNRRAEQF